MFPLVQSSYGFRQQAIKEKVPRVLPRNALHSLTARRRQRSTTRECSCADQSSHYNIGTTVRSSLGNPFWNLLKHGPSVGSNNLGRKPVGRFNGRLCELGIDYLIEDG